MVLSRAARRALALLLLRRRRKRSAKYWVHPLNTRRVTLGEYNRLCQELEIFPEKYFQYFRMAKESFDRLHSLIKVDIMKENTNYREAIPTRERLAVTLRFLATGMSFRAIAFSYRIGETTVNKIVKDTCIAIRKNLLPIYIPKISTEVWKKIRNGFYRKWNMPNCVGAVDGKHVTIFAPRNSGSAFFNYKASFSIVLMAVVDADYKYTMIDVGSYGSNSDGGIFAKCSFGKAWLSNDQKLAVPQKNTLPHSDVSLPLVLVADEAFPLKENILRPFPGRNLSDRERVFNYRLSRARRVVENAFGITAHVWRILLKRIEVNVDYASIITVACCILHNFILTESSNNDISADASIPNNLNRYTIVNDHCADDANNRYARPTRHAMDIRNRFADWFSSPAGEVPWQYEAIQK